MRLIDQIWEMQSKQFDPENWPATLTKITETILNDAAQACPENKIAIGHDNDVIHQKLSEFAAKSGISIDTDHIDGYRVSILSWGSARNDKIRQMAHYVYATGKLLE